MVYLLTASCMTGSAWLARVGSVNRRSVKVDSLPTLFKLPVKVTDFESLGRPEPRSPAFFLLGLRKSQNCVSFNVQVFFSSISAV
jgi:hypothetical protein